MILYVTKETFERYHLKMPAQMEDELSRKLSQAVLDRESGDRFLEWGGKLFYIGGKKCLQVTHFASKLTVVLYNFKVEHLTHLGGVLAEYLLDLYADKPNITRLLKQYFEEAHLLVFSQLKDRSTIATLNRTQLDLLDIDTIIHYVRGNVFHTKELCRDLNMDTPFSRKVDGKKDYFFPGELFAELLEERYGESTTLT